MKKWICFVLVLLVLGSFTGCNVTQNMSGAIAGKAEATPKLEEMMEALAAGNAEDAKVLMHPMISEGADIAIAQMSDFLAGRRVSSMELVSITVNTSAGTSGATRQERIGYRVTLEDDAIIYLNAIYLSNMEGTGFTSFQLVLGVV